MAGYLNAEGLAGIAIDRLWAHSPRRCGFLSEDPARAEACVQRGLQFVGPSAEVMRRAGDKTRARQAMIEAGVPVIPASAANLTSVAEAARVAEDIGCPVMLEATSVGAGAATTSPTCERSIHASFPRRPKRLAVRSCS